MRGHGLPAMVLVCAIGVFGLVAGPLFDPVPQSTLLPLTSLGLLTVSLVPLIIGWKKTRFSPLRPAMIWALMAAGLGILSQVRAFTEPLSDGRPATGLLAYLWMAATLASLTSVLGARRPGTGAWALLMIMLFGVMLLPLLEASLFSSRSFRIERLRLDAPWSIFVAVVFVTGISNYLFTKWCLTALLLGAGLLVEYVAMISLGWPAHRRALAWSIGPGLAGLAMILTLLGSTQHGPGSDLEARWMWFRDRWGVVWALRVRERFNQTAERLNWPVRLSWQGVRTTSGKPCTEDEVPADAASTFDLLIRRFTTPR